MAKYKVSYKWFDNEDLQNGRGFNQQRTTIFHTFYGFDEDKVISDAITLIERTIYDNYEEVEVYDPETNESEYHPYHLDVDYDAQEIEMYDDVTGELIELYTDFEAYEVD